MRVLGLMSGTSLDGADAVLVVNPPKQGVGHYIGANAFAEIAIAFYFGKKIFLLYDQFPPYADELSAWGVVPLRGDLGLLASIIKG